MSGTHDFEIRSAKRVRLSSDASEAQSHPSIANSSALQRHPEIWFDDGNVILATQGIAFRVYRGLLSGQSTVFSDMFASSTPIPSETFDECPLVHLSDSPYDLAHLLRVLLPKSHIQYHMPKADPVQRTFDEVSAVIRLAHKYGIQPVQDQALACIQEHCYPSDFAVFSAPSPDSESSPFTSIRRGHAISAVNLARLTDTPSILPLALYRCASLNSNALLNGWTRADGTIERLSDTDLRRCLDGRVALAHERFFFVSRLFDDTPSKDCRSSKRCGRHLRDVHHSAMRSPGLIQVEERSGGVLADWEPVVRSFKDGHNSLCGSCVEMLVERALSGRKRLWNRLPRIFGINVEGWGEPDAESGSEDSDNDDEDQ